MNMQLTDRQRAVLDHLEGRDFTSPTMIAKAVWGPKHHSASASPVCKRLVELGHVERSPDGWYRCAHRIKVGDHVWFLKSMRRCKVVSIDGHGGYELEALEGGKQLYATVQGVARLDDPDMPTSD